MSRHMHFKSHEQLIEEIRELEKKIAQYQENNAERLSFKEPKPIEGVDEALEDLTTFIEWSDIIIQTVNDSEIKSTVTNQLSISIKKHLIQSKKHLNA